MDLQFLGIGAAFNPAFGNTSACFQKDGTLYLLDCGSTVFGALLERKAMQGAKRIVVLITHLHADHVGSLGTLISYCNFKVNRKFFCLFALRVKPQHITNLIHFYDKF